ncbi:MAG: S8 family serine peptidase [Bacteroidales bacterium]|nr:S8 family serine peptidase [Bacteroidales bacterium]
MKRTFAILALFVAFVGYLNAQSCYWVFLTDKAGTTFDPYSYFDAKAIERYQLNNADLYDISNYPLNNSYVQQVDAIATEEVGTSRWLNAIGVMATQDQIARIEQLPFVKEVQIIATEAQIASYKVPATKANQPQLDQVLPNNSPALTEQLIRFQGAQFRDNNIDATGIRIAVFDGGFPAVNTHDAFKHLRDGGRIKATWNFCNKKENVYGWSTHGTMVLSCIAGIINGQQLGLATGAEFILARTEIESEPFKEEVWWAQAAEWADKNGANVINSSLGYGKERHFTYEMDGRSYVAKAANMAARKGMLICNSAGNEGDDSRWKTIITPADADSVLCVAGIEDNLTLYRHIEFSSYGPGADGRLKPNIAAFGHAIVANPKKDHETTEAYGTSFSSPLCAGFCACAWQTRPGLTAMQMKEEIEKSCDRYPYFDYALGYGVPQASYFIEKQHPAPEPTFSFKDTLDYVFIELPAMRSKTETDNDETSRPSIFDSKTEYQKEEVAVVDVVEEVIEVAIDEDKDSKNYTDIKSMKWPTVFFKVVNDTNGIDEYNFVEVDRPQEDLKIAIHKDGLVGRKLVVNYRGYTNVYTLNDNERKQRILDGNATKEFSWEVVDSSYHYTWDYTTHLSRTPDDLETSKVSYGGGSESSLDWAFTFGYPLPTTANEMRLGSFEGINFGFEGRWVRQLKKWYGLGIGFGWEHQRWSLPTDASQFNLIRLEDDLGMYDATTGLTYNNTDLSYRMMHRSNWNIELFQRIRLMPGGKLFSRGLHWDLGVYGNFGNYHYTTAYNYTINGTINANSEERTFYSPEFLDNYKLQWGLVSRLSWDWIGIYARYNMTNVFGNQITTLSMEPGNYYLNLPRLDVGLQIEF